MSSLSSAQNYLFQIGDPTGKKIIFFIDGW
jgi:hypothetical protein